MKCTPQNTMASASERPLAAVASWKESPDVVRVLHDLLPLVEVARITTLSPRVAFAARIRPSSSSSEASLVLDGQFALSG